MSDSYKVVKLSKSNIERLLEFADDKSATPNQIISFLLDGIEQGKTVFKRVKKQARIKDCHYVCDFKKNCFNYFERECPRLKRHKDDFVKTGESVLFEFYEEKNKKRRRSIREKILRK